MTAVLIDPIEAKRLYQAAYDFLVNRPGATREMVERHLSPLPTSQRPTTLAGIYEHLLESAQNATMSPKVIGGAIGGIANLWSVLLEFEPRAIAGAFGLDDARVLDAVIAALHPTGQVRRVPQGLWPRFCRTITTGAAFLSQFEDADDFFRWVDSFDGDPRSRPALPLVISREVAGIGFALACDFIKDLGYHNFGKPDTHIKKLLAALGICTSDDDFVVFQALTAMAQRAGVPVFALDTLLWLIGSGNFYRDGVKIGSHREAFIQHLKLIHAVG